MRCPSVCALLLTACSGATASAPGAPTPGAPPAAAPGRPATASDAPVELSGEWNDVDAELVANEIIDDFLRSAWIAEWQAQHASAVPTLRLFPIKNRTTGYIDTRFFTKRFEATIVRSGKMRVELALGEKPRSSDGEDVLTQADSDVKASAERAVDFVMTGTLIAQEDRAGDREVQAYLATVEIVETATQRKAWIGQKRIRKLIDHRPGGSP